MFNKKARILVIAALTTGACQVSGAQSDQSLETKLAQTQKPNIVFIYTDDLGYHDLSLTGSDIIQTPAIDSLAQSSLQFRQAYASYPRCTPSRYGLMTATYPVNENKGDLGSIPTESNPIAQFNEAGYETFFLGKWHLGKGESSPTGYGFDRSYAAGETGGTHSHFYPFGKEGAPAAGEKSSVPDVTEDGKPGDFLTDLMTDKAVDYIQEKADTPEDPFMLMISYYAVHTPLEAKPEDLKRNKSEIKAYDFGDVPAFIQEGEGRRKMRQDHPAYAGLVENVDENVGRILDALNKTGMDKNTIVVFSSDHGGLSNDGNGRERDLATTNTPLKAGKGHLYEGGIRVPLFIKWPGVIDNGTDNDSVVLGMDLMPTLLDFVSGDALEDVDGESAKSVILNDESWSDRTVFWHSAKARPYSTGDMPATAIRRGDYKLIEFFDENRVELYNVKEDISETVDLSDSMPELKNELLAEIAAWRAEKNVKAKGKINKKKAQQAQRQKDKKAERRAKRRGQ